MTRREATIVSAYTGYFIGELEDLYKYLSDCFFPHGMQVAKADSHLLQKMEQEPCSLQEE